MNKVLWFKPINASRDTIGLFFNGNEYFVFNNIIYSYELSFENINTAYFFIDSSLKRKAHPLLKQLERKFESNLYQELIK